jgi:hypothetical protein
VTAAVNQKHKFSIGQHVRYSSLVPDRLRASGKYEITGLLPIEGTYLQYRIRNTLEKFERIASEWQLDVIAVHR